MDSKISPQTENTTVIFFQKILCYQVEVPLPPDQALATVEAEPATWTDHDSARINNTEYDYFQIEGT